jgi:hypothetical protein
MVGGVRRERAGYGIDEWIYGWYATIFIKK